MVIAWVGVVIAAFSVIITATIAGVIAAMVGILYFGHWLVYKILILAFGFKIVTSGDVCVSNTLPTHNGETALHSDATVGSDIEQIELQNMPTPVKK